MLFDLDGNEMAAFIYLFYPDPFTICLPFTHKLQQDVFYTALCHTVYSIWASVKNLRVLLYSCFCLLNAEVCLWMVLYVNRFYLVA